MKNNLLLGAILVGIALIAGMIWNFGLFRAGATVSDISEGSYSTSTYYSTIVGSQATGGCVLLKGVTSTTGGPSSGKVGGVLENLVFTGFSTGGTSFIGFYDATTSNSALRTGAKATTTITLVEIYAGESASTTQKDFNIAFNTGLLMCATGNLSSSTVTWK